MNTITSFRETADTSVVFQPANYPAPPSNRGAFMGTNLFGSAAYNYDPWDWAEDGVVGSTVEVVCGSKNSGKSAMTKSYARRMRLRRANKIGRIPHTQAYDLKPLLQDDREKYDDDGALIDIGDPTKQKRRAGEWRPLALFYDCEPVAPATRRYNFMHSDLKLQFSENLRQLQWAIEREINASMEYHQMEALKIAIWMMREGKNGLRPGFDHAFAAADKMSDGNIDDFGAGIYAELLTQARNDPYYMNEGSDGSLLAEFEASLRDPRNVDHRLIRRGAAEIAGIIDTIRRKYPWMCGIDSPYEAFSQDVLVHDLDGMSDEEVAEYQSQLRVLSGAASRRQDKNLMIDIDIHEENAVSVNQITYVRDMLPYVSQVRQDARVIRFIIQHLQAYANAGGEGSEISRKAVEMLSHVDHFWMGGLPKAQIDWVHGNVFQMTDFERYAVQHLTTGQFGHKAMPNHNMQFVDYQLVGSDFALIESNTALHDRQG